MNLEDLKLKIKDHPISDIVGMYIPVTPKGPHHVALCPFHDDHNPSLSINNDKGLFMCFVDNTGGDAIHFVQEYKNLSFIDALKDICTKMGWNFEHYQQRKKRSPQVVMAEKILQKAQTIYKKIAESNRPREFCSFIKERNLSEQSIREFSLGFSPKNNCLSEYLQSIKDDSERNLACRIARDIHLIRQKEGAFYDTFRERIMFPIHNSSGLVVGFCGRKTKDYQKAKYMNSQDSFIFHKKNILYGLPMAIGEIRKRDAVILTEGHMDCMALHRHGITNSVALMGLALGEKALERVLSLTKNFYLALDNDKAGFNAACRINELLMGRGILPRFIDLSAHKDPDEFLASEGKISFDKRYQESLPFIDILIERKWPKKIPQVVDRQVELFEKFFHLLAPLEMALCATERVVTLGQKLGMHSSAGLLVDSYKEFLSHKKIKTKKHFPPTHAVKQKDSPKESTQASPPTKAEMALIREIILTPQIFKMPEFSPLLDFLEENELKGYILELKDLYYSVGEDQYPMTVKIMKKERKLGQEVGDFINIILEHYTSITKEERIVKKILDGLSFKFQKERLIAMKKRLKEKQKNMTSPDEGKSILVKLSTIERELVTLKH